MAYPKTKSSFFLTRLFKITWCILICLAKSWQVFFWSNMPVKGTQKNTEADNRIFLESEHNHHFFMRCRRDLKKRHFYSEKDTFIVISQNTQKMCQISNHLIHQQPNFLMIHIHGLNKWQECQPNHSDYSALKMVEQVRFPGSWPQVSGPKNQVGPWYGTRDPESRTWMP